MLKNLIERAETWPREAQEELAHIASEIESEIGADAYHATPEELAGVDRGLTEAREGRFATDKKVNAVFSKFLGS